jgi:hypothetical protein
MGHLTHMGRCEIRAEFWSEFLEGQKRWETSNQIGVNNTFDS